MKISIKIKQTKCKMYIHLKLKSIRSSKCSVSLINYINTCREKINEEHEDKMDWWCDAKRQEVDGRIEEEFRYSLGFRCGESWKVRMVRTCGV